MLRELAIRYLMWTLKGNDILELVIRNDNYTMYQRDKIKEYNVKRTLEQIN